MPHVKPDEDFEAEMDADTLVRAQEIKSDPSRLERAKSAARRKAEKADSMVTALEKDREPEENAGLRRIPIK